MEGQKHTLAWMNVWELAENARLLSRFFVEMSNTRIHENVFTKVLRIISSTSAVALVGKTTNGSQQTREARQTKEGA